MNEIKINLAPAITSTQQQAEKTLEDKLNNAASRIVNTLLDSGQYHGHTEGLAHEIIRKKIEEYVLSDKFSTLVDTAIENAVEEETAQAVKVLLNSKTRKHLFSAIEHK